MMIFKNKSGQLLILREDTNDKVHLNAEFYDFISAPRWEYHLHEGSKAAALILLDSLDAKLIYQDDDDED